MQDRYVVFLDIDGTVYCGGEICARNRAAIAAARNAGHKICINTARPMADIPEAVRSMPWDGFVAGAGSTVIAAGETLLSVGMPQAELASVFDELTQAGYPMRVESERLLLCSCIYPLPHDFIPIRNGSVLLNEYADETFCKAFLPCVLPKPIRRRLAHRFQFFQHHSYAEFSVKGLSKASGMQRVLDYYGADRAHCIAMGDSINDLDMLRAAGISAAMGDASPEVKAVCTYISCAGKDGGVGEALYALLQLPAEKNADTHKKMRESS